MGSANKHQGAPPDQHDDAPPVARQGVKNMQSIGRALQRGDDTTAQVAWGLPRTKRRRAKLTYWSTTPLTWEQMAGAIQHCRPAGRGRYGDLPAPHGDPLSPSQVHEIGLRGGKRWLLTSVRRSISNLSDPQCGLVHLQGTRMGPHGRPGGLWSLPPSRASA